MSWVCLDDGAFANPKLLAAGLEATRLCLRALSWLAAGAVYDDRGPGW